jgi:histidinol-phosphatase (PHP family)
VTPCGFIDYHLHTATSSDAKATVGEYCARASQLGLREIAITNHMNVRTSDYHITSQQLVTLCNEIEILRASFPNVVVRLGIEVDYFDDAQAKIGETLDEYRRVLGRPFDFIMGSVHVLRNVRFASPKQAARLYSGADAATLFREYFFLMDRAVRTEMFDVMGHADLIKRFSGVHSPLVPFEVYEGAAGKLISSLIQLGVGLEVNVKGLEHPVKEIYPSDDFLAAYLAATDAAGKKPILTLGSDAHAVDGLGLHLDEGIRMLARHGVHQLTTFDRRTQVPFALAFRDTAGEEHT